jgi:hypothetical protein
MIYVSYGVFFVTIGGLIVAGCWVAVDMNAVAGRVHGRRKGVFLIGCGQALLSPNPVPLSFCDGDALQHAMHCRYSSF